FLQPAGRIAEAFPDIGRGKLDAVFLKWVRQQTERLLLDLALARVWGRRRSVIRLFVLLCEDIASRNKARGNQRQTTEVTDLKQCGHLVSPAEEVLFADGHVRRLVSSRPARQRMFVRC